MIKKNLEYLLVCSILLLSSFQLNAISKATMSSPVFGVIAMKKAPPSLLANEISSAQYKIVNNTKTTRLLTMLPIKGVNQLTGPGLCSNPFLLEPQQSCTLNLQLNAAVMNSNHSGPVICKTQSANNNNPSPFLCSQPGLQDQLKVEIIPCSSGTCLDTPSITQLRTITNQLRQQYGIPGIVAGIWIGGKGQLIIEDGLADLSTSRPISRYDHFRIGSVTKSFTVTAVLQLIEQGLLQLNTSLSQFLPGVQNDNTSVEQLADMTSGIFNYTENQDFINEFIRDLTKAWLPMQLISAVDTNPPYFPAGSNWHYSNTNTVILGIIIEMITHNSIANEITQRLLVPLKLSNTFYPDTVPMPESFAHGYGFDPLTDLTNTTPTSAAASGAIVSNLEDLHTWGIALGKGQLLSPELQNIRLNSMKPIVFSPCTDTLPGREMVNCPEYDKYGMGIGEIQGWVGHTGEFVGYSSLVLYNPQTDSTIVILMNLFGLNQHLPTTLFKQYLTIL